MNYDKSQTICFTGHRPKLLWGYYGSAMNKYNNLVSYLTDTVLPDLYNKGFRNYITGGAQGFDQLVFEAVDTFKHTHPDVKNIIYCPCLNQEKMWMEGQSRFCKGYYHAQLSRADEVVYITNTEYTLPCMNARNEAMLNDSAGVVALFNDNLTIIKKSQSGTENTIALAIERPNYQIYQIAYDLNDSTNYKYLSFISEELQALKKRKTKPAEKNENYLSNNTNPVPPLPENGFGDKICFDCETTGFSSGIFDELLQIAIVGSNGNEWMTYIKPDKKKTWANAEAVHHISPSMVQNAPSAREVMKALQPYFNEATTIIGHNIAFDIRFVERTGLNLENKRIWDTFEFFKSDIPEGKHKLEMAVEAYCTDFKEEYLNGAHDALTDTRATMRVFEAQCDKELSLDLE